MIIVTGDVTIPSGVTLTVAPGTEVHFVANSDDTNSGNDGTLSELIVADGGVLEAEAGTAEADHITFRSANDTPLQNEWYGIRVESGGSATLTDVTVRDGMHCAKAEAGGSLTLTDETLSNLSNCGTPPEISGEPEEPEFPEHSDSEAVVATYTANDDEEDAVRWSLDGDDASAFTIDSDDGELRFRPVSDFEALLDAGRVLEADGTIAYAVTVQAEDSQRATATLPVTVRVLNVEEEGTVTVEPTMPRADGSLSPPRVDEELTAALQDLDRVMTGTEHWTWQRQAPGETMVEITDADAADATYTPVDGDIGYLLQATVSYDDGQGTGKSAVSEPTAAVVGAPAAPEVKATAADARVVLTWQAAPANGLPVQHDETQYSSDGIPWSGFTEVDGKDTARETTVGGLTNDIEYTFEVRAVNEAGDGEAASTSATPHFVINESEATSVSFAEIPEGTQEWNPLVATYTTNKAEDTPVTWSLGGTDKSAFVITETDGAGTLSFSAAPDYENPTDADTDTVYAVTVRAQVRAGHPDGLDGLCRGGGESDQ